MSEAVTSSSVGVILENVWRTALTPQPLSPERPANVSYVVVNSVLPPAAHGRPETVAGQGRITTRLRRWTCSIEVIQRSQSSRSAD
jgi:hypothetical protein